MFLEQLCILSACQWSMAWLKLSIIYQSFGPLYTNIKLIFINSKIKINLLLLFFGNISYIICFNLGGEDVERISMIMHCSPSPGKH